MHRRTTALVWDPLAKHELVLSYETSPRLRFSIAHFFEDRLHINSYIEVDLRKERLTAPTSIDITVERTENGKRWDAIMYMCC